MMMMMMMIYNQKFRLSTFSQISFRIFKLFFLSDFLFIFHFIELKTLIIDSKQTMFWRYQRGRPMNHLSTIEAIYYLLIQIHMTMFDLFNNHHDHDHHDHCHMNVNEIFTTEYNGQYDNLLFFFKHTFNLIKNRYHL